MIADPDGPVFERLVTNDDVTAAVADWRGPVDHDRELGFAELAEDEDSGLFFGYTVVRAGMFSFNERLDDAVPLDDAMAWARARVARVTLR